MWPLCTLGSVQLIVTGLGSIEEPQRTDYHHSDHQTTSCASSPPRLPSTKTRTGEETASMVSLRNGDWV